MILRFSLLGLLVLLAAPAAAESPVVRRIVVERSPIFDATDRERLPWLPLGLVNWVHVDTHPRVIRRELVFREGDRVDEEDLDESERKLRSTGFFAEAWVEAETVAPDTVDVRVRTRELWTTALNGSVEKFEDQLLWALEVRERNFLGRAKSFLVSRRVDEDRSTWSVGAGDRQMFDGTWQGDFRLASSDDGDATTWRLRRPFFRLGSDWGGGIEYAHGGARPRYYTSGETYVRPRADGTGLDLNVMRRVRSTPHGIWRAGLGLRRSNQRFSPEAGLTEFLTEGGDVGEVDFPAQVREDRNLHVAYLQFRRVSRDYARERFLFGMGRIEDLALGWEHQFQLGWANRIFGGSLSGLDFRGSHRWLRTGRTSVLVRADLSGILTQGEAENLRTSVATGVYLSVRPDTRVALGLLGGTSTHMDRNGVYTLGAENGLRAAGFQEFAGDRILRGNAEIRWVHREGWLDLFTPGLAAFVDFGTAWFEDEIDWTWRRLRGAVGVGLRIGLNRASQDRPIRVDLGWPILYDNDRSAPVITIGSGQAF